MDKLKIKLVYGFFKVLSLLPLRVLLALSDCFVYPLVYHVVGYRLKVVRRNLRNSFPSMSDKELKTIERRFYRHFCDSFMETVRILSMSTEEAVQRMHFVNPELVTNYLSKGQGVMMMLGHYGNWEYQPFLFLNVLESEKQEGFSVYRPLKSKSFDYLYYKIRTHFKGGVVTKDETYRTIIRLKRAGKPGVFGMVCDQSPSRNNLHYWTNFLHQDTSILTGSERIAVKTGFAVIFADVEKLGRGYYQTTYHLISDNAQGTAPNEITEQYARLMEQTILRDPAYWLWTHRRWKHHRSDQAAAE